MNAGKLITGLLAFFLVCALVTGQCLCTTTVAPWHSPAPVWDWVDGPEVTVRTYPVHIHATGELEDDATEASYEYHRYEDPVEHTFVYPGGCNEALTKWPIIDATPEDSTLEYCSSLGEIVNLANYQYYIAGIRTELEWDFTNLPANATILSTTLHYQTHCQGDFPTHYVSSNLMFDGVAIPGHGNETTVTGDVTAGTNWTPATTQTIDIRVSMLSVQQCDQSHWTRLELGWGNFSEGECTYMDVTYTVPVWQCVENCP